MSDKAGFLRDIIENQDDDNPRLIYADLSKRSAFLNCEARPDPSDVPPWADGGIFPVPEAEKDCLEKFKKKRVDNRERLGYPLP